MPEINRTIRGLDQELYLKARADAISRGYKKFGDWVNEAWIYFLTVSNAGKKGETGKKH